MITESGDCGTKRKARASNKQRAESQQVQLGAAGKALKEERKPVAHGDAVHAVVTGQRGGVVEAGAVA